MNLNQSEIKEEKELLEKVIDFNLLLGSSHICFREIFDKVELDLSKPNEYDHEVIPISLLEEKKQELEQRIQKLEKEQQQLIEEKNKYIQGHPDAMEISPYPHELQLLFDKMGEISDVLLPSLGSELREIKDSISNNGCVNTPKLGFFVPVEQMVYLCIDNINNAGFPRESVLIMTFIHEMFHAWNYFSSGCKERTVREIDEPMVEFGTLLFLQEIAKLDSVFEPIFDCAKSIVQKKQDKIGGLAAYGFGYYLFSLINSKEQNTVQKLLEAYSRKAGSIIAFPKLIHQIKDLLYPYYPREKESDVFELFWRVMFTNPIKGQVWSKSGKTNIITDNDILLFDDNVDDITPIEYEGSGDKLIKIENNGVFMIYYCHRHRSWHPLFDEIFEEIAEIKYREKNVIFVRPQNDKKAYLITHFDIRRIIEIRNHSNMTSNSGSLWQSRCLSADDFMVYNGTNTDMGDNCLFAKSNQSYYYVPYCSQQSKNCRNRF